MKLLAAGLLVLSTGVSAAAPATNSKTLERKLSSYVQSYARSGLFSGVVLVEKDGRVIYLGASGIAERSFNTPVTVDTKFHIASLSKPITSAAIGRLVDQGKLTYETKLETLVPGIPNGDRITIEQLLTHYSGLDSPDREKGASNWFKFPQTPADLVERVRASKPMWEPGEKYEYSNANYWLLAAVIEKISNQSYGDFLKREIFDPLGMNDTAHRGDLLAVIPKLAVGYQPDGPNEWRVSEILDWTSKTGNGSIYSTARDIAKFYDAFLGGKLVKPETAARMRPPKGKQVGYGWFSKDRDGKGSLWYNGRSPGYGAYLEGFDGTSTSFVILSNLYTYAPTAMAEGIANILWDKPYEEMAPIKLYPATSAQLKSFEGTFQFGPDFHVRNGKARLEAAGDHLRMHWDAGDRVTMLLPVGANKFFDPTFWATIIIDGPGGQKLIHYKSLGFSKVYEARQIVQ